MEEGWEFVWRANKPPYVKLPNGKSIQCLLKGNVPYLPDTLPAQVDDCAPAEPVDDAASDNDHDQSEYGPALPPDGVVPHEDDDIAGDEKDDDDDIPPAGPRRGTVEEALSLNHMLSHRFKNPHCRTCQPPKMQHVAAQSRAMDPADAPLQFGEQITADHAVFNEANRGLRGERAALIVLDRATQWIAGYPVGDKSANAAVTALRHFAGVNRVPQKFYSDN